MWSSAASKCSLCVCTRASALRQSHRILRARASESIMKIRRCSSRSCLRASVAMGSVLFGLLPGPARCQITPEQVNLILNGIGNRIDALAILTGDFGFAGGNFRTSGKFTTGGSSNAELLVTKLGGAGDFGDPQPVGTLDVGWQGRIQGNMGYLEARNHLHSPQLEGDINTYKEAAVEFGGGVRFWVSERVSLAPTVMGIYGRTSNSYTANSAFMQLNLPRAIEMGLVDWSVNTGTVRTAVNIQYLFNWGRTRIKLSSEPAYFRTESFNGSHANINATGDSGAIANTIDIDIPLGIELFGHELRSGGDFTRTQLFGDLRAGLNVQYINELHGRLVLDYLNELWKFQWIGVGASYVWGSTLTGWTAGLDVAFRF